MTKEFDFAVLAIDKMFQIAGHDVSFNTIPEGDWFEQYTMTREQEEQWKEWFVQEARKKLKWSKFMAQREYEMFNLSYGLKREL